MENLHLVLGGGKKFDNITSDAEFNNAGKEIIVCIFLSCYSHGPWRLSLSSSSDWSGQCSQTSPRTRHLDYWPSQGLILSELPKWPKLSICQYWDNVWKSRGFIVVNGVPREVPRPEPEGPQAPRVFVRGTSWGTPFTMINPRHFHTFSSFRHPELVKRDFFIQWCP